MDTKKVEDREKIFLIQVEREETQAAEKENGFMPKQEIIHKKNRYYILSVETKRSLAHILTEYKKKRDSYRKDKEKRK